MSFITKIRNLMKENFTFIVVPHNGKSTKQLKLNKPAIYFTLALFTAFFIFFIASTFYLFTTNTALSQNITQKSDKINRLNDIVKRQHTEIDELKNTSSIVINKLSHLYDLESKVRTMVGLSSDENVEKPVASRSLNIFSETLSTLNSENFNDVSSLVDSESVDAITDLISSQTENYGSLIKDVEKQLKFLESKPDLWPVRGKISSPFGYRKHPISKRRHFHKGIDISNNSGTNIVSSGSGIVTFSGWNGGYGRVIIVSHGYGYKSVYAHNKNNLVKVGDRVTKGQVIAKLGNTGRSTGPHLHFEIRFNGQHINPINVLEEK